MAAINWINPARGRTSTTGGSKPADYSFYVSNCKSGRKEREEQQGSIRVSMLAMKKLRWIGGDRVQIGVDDKHVYVKRVQTGGYALSPVGGVKKNAGKLTACNIKTSRINFKATACITEKDYVVLEDGTVMFEAAAEAV
jgi:hypothetical protein